MFLSPVPPAPSGEIPSLMLPCVPSPSPSECKLDELEAVSAFDDCGKSAYSAAPGGLPPHATVFGPSFEQHVRHELVCIHQKLDRLIEQGAQRPALLPMPEKAADRGAVLRSETRKHSKTPRTQDPKKLARAGSSASALSTNSAKLRQSLSGLELVLAPPSTLTREKTGGTLGTPSVALTRAGTGAAHLSRAGTTATHAALTRERSGMVTPTPRSLREAFTGMFSHSSTTAMTEAEVIPERSTSMNPVTGDAEEPVGVGVAPSSSVKAADLERAEIMLSYQNRRHSFNHIQVAWDFLESPDSSTSAWVFATMTPIFILTTVCLTLLQSSGNSPVYGVHAAVLETVIDSIFLLEVIVRLVCCPNKKAFIFDPYNIIDVLAAVPLAIRAAIGFVLPRGEVASVPHGILLCAVPVVRLLKTLRRFEKFHLILNAFRLAAEALPVMLFILSMIALTFAMLIYIVEPRDNIESIPMSLWLTIVTMSTVGYGDMTPKTAAGHMITGALIVITALYMSIPLGIVGNAFSITWDSRDKILLMQRTRDRLRQWGYSAHDIPALFQVTASSPDGALDINDFRKLLLRMQIGFSEERILKLFQSFDEDGSGSVDDREFIRHLFPSAFHEIYGKEDEDEEEDTDKDGEKEDDGKEDVGKEKRSSLS